ncbi:hypothetical protein [Ferroplasma acidiphilum]|uniref:hypothetical protein n=1 Tax=Ferroplasma acidiphilum TaxID=74969 RepID=UPI002814E2AE|nr:hypothetical protein [Ferroplasma acidiphilum]WMT53118.1 MAG: hypothetical protein RE473_08940 [Ferroplasma acidiphilum]
MLATLNQLLNAYTNCIQIITVRFAAAKKLFVLWHLSKPGFSAMGLWVYYCSPALKLASRENVK